VGPDPRGDHRRHHGDPPVTRILAISGSLRERSYNRALLRAAEELAPAGVKIEEFDLSPIPFYDGDVEAAGDPASVVALRAAVAEADGVLIATPEYNRGTSGVLKNAIDWLSRPALASVLRWKPVAVIGASTGRGGTRRRAATGTRCAALPRRDRARGAGGRPPGRVGALRRGRPARGREDPRLDPRPPRGPRRRPQGTAARRSGIVKA
jgi:hypothetical protein